jgi:NDP-sugar pyrophosphorylase family protein
MSDTAEASDSPATGLARIDAAILAGGLGTRVAQFLGELPKIMAPCGDRPLLDHLLDWLADQGVRRVVLCLGYRATPVLEHLQRAQRRDLEVVISVEPEPLGTAGGLAHARSLFQSDPVFVLNGDTLADVDLRAFLAAYRGAGTRLAVVAARVDDAGRYGGMEIDRCSRVIRFCEKGGGEEDPPRWVSAGLYCLSRELLDEIAALGRGSLERQVFEREPSGSILAFPIDGPFLDIGTPETLAGAGGNGGSRK